MWLIIGAAIISVSYFILIFIFESGWKRIPNFELQKFNTEPIFISVIIASKNEYNNLPQLISSLSHQSYKNFELIIIDDHSTDKSSEILPVLFKNINDFHIINAIGFGKKNAIKEGMALAKGDFIVTCDADCIPNLSWLETIAQFQAKYNFDLIICPVKYMRNESLFHKLQDLEFTTLVASGAGAAGYGMPILCNGANLAFKKSAWLNGQTRLHEEEQSGDDIFLLESIKRNKGKIQFLKSETAFVLTEPSENIIQFIKQRRRWAGKSSAYTDWQLISTACIILAISILILILLGISIVDCKYIVGFILVFSLKYLLDIHFLQQVKCFFQLENIWVNALLLSFIYPFYIVFIALSSMMIKPNKWN